MLAFRLHVIPAIREAQVKRSRSKASLSQDFKKKVRETLSEK
jgi:hypothetical protein